MKNIFKTLVIISIALAIYGCEVLGPLNNMEPENVLTDETLITDANSAEVALNGVYKTWRSMEISSMRYAYNILTKVQSFASIFGYSEFISNNVQPTNITNENYYLSLYYVINSANTVISALNKEEISGLNNIRKNEMIAECRFHRALANFLLLRTYGKFYDKNSSDGIVIWEEPVRDNIAKGRSSVKDCYDSICKDLEFAINNCPTNVAGGYYISKATALGLYTRVFLYMNDFQNAVKYGNMTLNMASETNYSLESEYNDIFTNSYESSEMLFAPYTLNPNQSLFSSWESFSYGALGDGIKGVSDELIEGDGDILTGEGYDYRFSQTFASANQIGNSGINKYIYDNFTVGEKSNTYYFIRLAEIYLIVAESEARLKNYDNARLALKAITDRAQYDEEYVNSISNEDLLLMILKHKYVELTSENNEDWFDMVRYHIIDNINFEELGMSVPMNHYIMPIPRAALAGNNLLSPNQEYL